MTQHPRFRVLDLFSGTGSATEPWASAHDVVSVELDPRFEATITADVLDLTVEGLAEHGPFDFIWASPPCTAFSVASIGHHWTGGRRAYIPKTEAASHNQELVAHTIRLIAGLTPRWWVMENPRGVLRKLPCVKGLPRHEVSLCQYGDTRMKPTDLWGVTPNGWEPRMCANGQPCHEAAPRGSRTGTQGLKNATERARLPYGLGHSLRDAAVCESMGVPA